MARAAGHRHVAACTGSTSEEIVAVHRHVLTTALVSLHRVTDIIDFRPVKPPTGAARLIAIS